MEHHQSAVRCRQSKATSDTWQATRFPVISDSDVYWKMKEWASGNTQLWDVHFCGIEINLDLYQWSMERTTVWPEICGKIITAWRKKVSFTLISPLIKKVAKYKVSQYFHYTSLQMFWKVMISVWRPPSLQLWKFPFSFYNFNVFNAALISKWAFTALFSCRD